MDIDLSKDPSGHKFNDQLLEANRALLAMSDQTSAAPMHKDPLLAARGARYGAFKDNSKISQALKAVMRQEPKWQALDPDMKEALEMIAHKISRILAGDPYYDDSWVDVSGYATRVADRLKK